MGDLAATTTTSRSTPATSYRLAVDIGGTFTDLVLLNETTGQMTVAKTPSTPRDPAEGFIAGIRKVLRLAGAEPGRLREILLGTTAATNAVLERRGARLGLIVTEGFRDMLEIARANVPGRLTNEHRFVRPERLVPHERVREVPERSTFHGEVLSPLNETAARQALIELRDAGVECIAVSLLHAYANPAHERRIAELAKDVAPDVYLSLSSEVLPEYREYERTITTVLNAYVQPLIDRYLRNLRDRLHAEGIDAKLHVVRSDGGIMSAEFALARPVNTVLSGPAGGVQGASYVARLAGLANAIAMDMGGTSTDVSLTHAGSARVAIGTQIADLPVKVPVTDIVTIGAGGGSIAWLTESGALKVGPRSAGADPGPACYGRQNEGFGFWVLGVGGRDLKAPADHISTNPSQPHNSAHVGDTADAPSPDTRHPTPDTYVPTVTDANLVLGRLPAALLDGEIPLRVDLARAAVGQIAAAIGVSLETAAEGILAIANAGMLGALRVVSVQRGYDPRDFAVVPFGGAGPLHGADLARLLGARRVVAPPSPGVLSALGFLVADVKHTFTRTLIGVVEALDLDQVNHTLAELLAAGRAWLANEGIPIERTRLTATADTRYAGQSSELPIPIPDQLAANDLDRLRAEFHAAHKRLYGFDWPHAQVELVTLRVEAAGQPGDIMIHQLPLEAAASDHARVGSRPVYFGGWRETPIYARAKLRPGNQIAGPAVVEQMDSTTVILPGQRAEVDGYFNLVIEEGGREGFGVGC